MGIIGILTGSGKKDKSKLQNNNKRKLQTNDQIQQSRRCNKCGGYVMPNSIKSSQMICTNCGNRIHLY